MSDKQAHTGHRGDSGIQEHSCGEIMPWTIVLKGCGFPRQHIYALNGTTGEVLTSWHYSDEHVPGEQRIVFKNARSFKEAHELATTEAAGRLALDKLAEAA